MRRSQSLEFLSLFVSQPISGKGRARPPGRARGGHVVARRPASPAIGQRPPSDPAARAPRRGAPTRAAGAGKEGVPP